MTFTLGTHNLHDEAGVPTFFADVVFFTEAIAPTIIAKARQRWEFGKARLRGYRIVVCREQRDLVLAVRRRRFEVKSRQYTRYVDGVSGVTPNRGTFVVFALERPRGRGAARDAQLVAFVLEHRINAAFPPYIRGEAAFRRRAWLNHTAGTIQTVRRLTASGYVVHAGGDLNAPGRHNPHVPYESGYRGHLKELGEGLDRLASSARIAVPEYLSREGSDHPRLRATVREAA